MLIPVCGHIFWHHSARKQRSNSKALHYKDAKVSHVLEHGLLNVREVHLEVHAAALHLRLERAEGAARGRLRLDPDSRNKAHLRMRWAYRVGAAMGNGENFVFPLRGKWSMHLHRSERLEYVLSVEKTELQVSMGAAAHVSLVILPQHADEGFVPPT